MPSSPQIAMFEVLAPRAALDMHPWDEWRKPDGVPVWWSAYNKVKHERDTEYKKANLKNALNAVAGLFVLVLFLNREKAESGELFPSPQMIKPGHPHVSAMTAGGYYSVEMYDLK